MSYGKGKLGSFSDAPSLGSAKPSRWTDQPAVVAAARRFVATNALDADDCRDLLDALGIGFTAEEVAEYRAAIEQDTPENTVTCPEEARN